MSYNKINAIRRSQGCVPGNQASGTGTEPEQQGPEPEPGTEQFKKIFRNRNGTGTAIPGTLDRNSIFWVKIEEKLYKNCQIRSVKNLAKIQLKIHTNSDKKRMKIDENFPKI